VALMRSEPTAVEHALDAMAVTLEDYARAAVESGADGLFYATNMATRELSTAGECRRFQRPYDLRILGRVESSPFNMLHVCGAGVLFDEFADYPATALSWATMPGNPTLSGAHRRTGRAVVGGLPAKPEIAGLPPAEIEARGRRAIGDNSIGNAAAFRRVDSCRSSICAITSAGSNAASATSIGRSAASIAVTRRLLKRPWNRSRMRNCRRQDLRTATHLPSSVGTCQATCAHASLTS